MGLGRTRGNLPAAGTLRRRMFAVPLPQQHLDAALVQFQPLRSDVIPLPLVERADHGAQQRGGGQLAQGGLALQQLDRAFPVLVDPAPVRLDRLSPCFSASCQRPTKVSVCGQSMWASQLSAKPASCSQACQAGQVSSSTTGGREVTTKRHRGYNWVKLLQGFQHPLPILPPHLVHPID